MFKLDLDTVNPMKRGFDTVKRYAPQAMSERIMTGWKDNAKEKRQDHKDPLVMTKDPKPNPKPGPNPKPPPPPRDDVGSRSSSSSVGLGA
ncbi:MAG: hypothetical protein HETSPECPRED_001214 [Heterodermia speciosa]|uniref:Uncharacterized protein n=1 Tax=Heterodermia speciosa TaxID=116794 RepID=A0A8H3IC04_9LECA|nr:MAG: hypothetical protein HETSPECPRED_001214 [Heterodermia speciosa]